MPATSGINIRPKRMEPSVAQIFSAVLTNPRYNPPRIVMANMSNIAMSMKFMKPRSPFIAAYSASAR